MHYLFLLPISVRQIVAEIFCISLHILDFHSFLDFEQFVAKIFCISLRMFSFYFLDTLVLKTLPLIGFQRKTPPGISLGYHNR